MTFLWKTKLMFLVATIFSVIMLAFVDRSKFVFQNLGILDCNTFHCSTPITAGMQIEFSSGNNGKDNQINKSIKGNLLNASFS